MAKYTHFDRSKALRLVFYRGLQPYKDLATPGTYPMLTAASTNQQGLSVARWGQALL